MEEDIAEAEAKMAEPGFWDDSEAAQKVINENNTNKETYDQFNALAEELEELALMVEMLQEEPDAQMQQEAEDRIQLLDEKMKTYELAMLLDGPYDRNHAIVELHPGAGVQNPKTGEVCCYACIHVGQNNMATKWKHWITKQGMKQE